MKLRPIAPTTAIGIVATQTAMKLRIVVLPLRSLAYRDLFRHTGPLRTQNHFRQVAVVATHNPRSLHGVIEMGEVRPTTI